ncbi:hypothetical protein BDP27DRAFT_1360956 [Rhodocollybia butyracea]|uniref:Uncharacterized protein n=1 Tax=Rhodocollybia butyracea TaxID=206335 RepID=A0A9P5UBZ6_9AGAR|nr:hypothetical protein BDP27DRAFT_1360956 [Rhodocollybia butyracea]
MPSWYWEEKQDCNKALFKYMLNQDADDVFKKLQVSSNKIWKMVAEADIVPGRTAAQMKTKFDASLATFKQLYKFRNFTGHGADADDYDWDNEEAVTTHLKNLLKAGNDIAGLSAKVCRLWMKEGWYDLFNNWYHDNPCVAHEVVRSLAGKISNYNPNSDPIKWPPSDDDVQITDGLKTPQHRGSAKKEKPTPRLPTPSSSLLTSRTSSGRKGRLSGNNESLSGLLQYSKTKAEVDEHVMKLREDDMQTKAQKEAYGDAKEVLKNCFNFDDDTVEYAKKIVQCYFQHAAEAL